MTTFAFLLYYFGLFVAAFVVGIGLACGWLRFRMWRSGRRRG